ncbi:Cytosolic carboxypeptidase 6, partial [Ophiophagus hannah]
MEGPCHILSPPLFSSQPSLVKLGGLKEFTNFLVGGSSSQCKISFHPLSSFSYQSSTSFNRDAVKAGTGRRFLGGLLDDTSYCYTLEVSFYSYIVGGTSSTVPYSEETCIL